MGAVLEIIKKKVGNTLYLDPNKIFLESQLDRTLEALNDYSKKNNCESVVALTENRQLGPRYFITSKYKAEKDINKQNECEKLIKFYTISDYLNLRNKIKQ